VLPLAACAVLYSSPANALPADFYAAESKLASGKWARVSVSEAGLQFISNTTLRNLGFADPAKVNVYGYGGRMLSEKLNAEMPDDLPLIPSLRTSSGIFFFGHANFSWEWQGGKTMEYTHTINAYSDKAYFFISDVDGDHVEPEKGEDVAPAADEPLTVFTERIVHEQDLLAPYVMGRRLLGEDFRSQPSRKFNFTLPDNTGDAKINIAFGAKVTNGNSSIVVAANGETLAATSSDKLNGVGNDDTFIAYQSSYKTVSDPGNQLSLNISYSATGAISTAALDYIEVEYPREIKLYNNELYFYVTPDRASTVTVQGCSDQTVIWNVTDPLKPMAVDFSLSGDKASFTAPKGYGEYLAFNPAKAPRSAVAAGSVPNQNLHGTPAPGMLVVAPSQYRNAAERLAALHASTDGLDVLVVTPEQVYNEFSSGAPDVTAFRKLLKMWYDRAEGDETAYTRFCLLFSRPTYDNKLVTPTLKRAGYPVIPIWQEAEGKTILSSYSTDDYVGMLEDNTRDLNMNTAKIHVAVGRMPVKSVAEAETAVTKLENYLLNPQLGAWRNNVMIIADDQDNGTHLIQAEDVWNSFLTAPKGNDLVYEKLYLDSYPLEQSALGVVYPAAKQRMLDKINEGVVYVDYIGHANPRSWTHENVLLWDDINSFSNKNLTFILAATCEFMNWDSDDVSGAEVMWLNPTSGVIGMLCPSRKVYISQNGTFNKELSKFTFALDSEGLPMRLGESMIRGKNMMGTNDDRNKLRFGFMGDPSMRLPVPLLNVVVDEIDGARLGVDEPPVIQARSRVTVKGHVADADGNLLQDYNGSVDLQLYDAERVITTYGNGKEGVEKTYNDRKTRLYIGKTKVTDGYWETTLLMPSEIENNYSPALLSLYACDDQRREASGSTQDFYVYGSDETLPADTEGPAITGLYLNSPAFVDGTAIGPSATLYASFEDESGINVSEAGIGHEMTVSLDGKTFFNDIQNYFTPDASEIGKGAVAYPLTGIEPGEHTLTFTVWDNANNSNSASLNFVVKAGWIPTISELSTDVNPATTSVVFSVGVDGTLGSMPCRLEVFDLGGRLIWSKDDSSLSEGSTMLNLSWDLTDTSGHRVPRGIYLYRATVTTANGAEVSETKKLAVTS
jgi:hypothetical protein